LWKVIGSNDYSSAGHFLRPGQNIQSGTFGIDLHLIWLEAQLFDQAVHGVYFHLLPVIALGEDQRMGHRPCCQGELAGTLEVR
jgi:hypothetical protein